MKIINLISKWINETHDPDMTLCLIMLCVSIFIPSIIILMIVFLT